VRDETPPSWAARAVISLGVLAAVVLVGRPAGAGLTVLLVALGAIAAVAARDRSDGAWTLVWWALAAALALVPVLRAAAWVLVPTVAAAALLASLAVSGGRRWGEVGAGLGALVAWTPPGALLVAHAASRGVSVRRAGPAARGAALAALLLAVFVPLLVSADAAFAQLLSDAVPTGLSVDRPVGRVLAGVVVAAAGGALLHGALHAPTARAPRAPRMTLGRLEWALPLGALVALLGAFVALQLATLFGGERHVLETAGLTYAEYARSGFAQLLAVAALTLAVVAAAARWAGDGGRLLRALLAALCLLTLVVLASALRRLGLYEDAYGFTRLRLTANGILWWLGALFSLVLVAGAVRRGTAWLPRAAVAVTAAALLLFALSDPDRRIADRNVDRFQRTGRIDVDYLAGLGPDAAGALVRLPGPRAACAAARLRRSLAGGDGLAGQCRPRPGAARARGGPRGGLRVVTERQLRW
jgi:hypothetical protein